MADRQQMNFILLQVEGVNDSIVANACTKTVLSFQPMVRKRGKARADLINLRFNARAKHSSQFKKDGVKGEKLSVRTTITTSVDHSRSRAHASYPSCVTVYPRGSRSRVFRLTHPCAFPVGHVALSMLD